MRICKNDITDMIRKHFGANPLKIPESRIRPMVVLEIKNNKLDFLGAFTDLVKGSMPEEPELKSSLVPKVSGVKTKKIAAGLGTKLLDNFLSAFKIDPAVVEAAINRSKELSFSFDEVNRIYIEPLRLGKILSDHQLQGDTENVFVKKIINDANHRLALITDALVSTNFSLTTFGENETGAEIDLPKIQQFVSDASLKVKVEKTATNEIKFVGQEPLTFAFSCVEINIDPVSGQFATGDWLKNIRSAKGMDNLDEAAISDEDLSKHAKLLIDSDQANQLLLEF